MKRSVLLTSTLLATLIGACTYNHALGVTNDGGPVHGSDGSATSSCSSCSVGCSELGANYPALRAIGSDGKSVFLASASGNAEAMLRINADDTIDTLVSNRATSIYSITVGATALAWWEAPSPGSSAASPVYVLPTEAMGTPRFLATINPGNVALDDTKLYYVASGTTTLSSIPIAGGAATGIATVTSSDLVAVDGDAVYYYDDAANVTRRQPKDGTTATNLAGAAAGGVSDGVNYYTGDASNLNAIPLDGSPVRTLVTWQSNHFYSAPQAFATDGERVYYIDPVCTTTLNTGCAIRSVPVAGGTVSTLCASLEQPLYISVTANGVYVVDGGGIFKLAKQ